MLERLEAERRASVGRALAAQEGERLRVAQELHDGVGRASPAWSCSWGASRGTLTPSPSRA